LLNFLKTIFPTFLCAKIEKVFFYFFATVPRSLIFAQLIPNNLLRIFKYYELASIEGSLYLIYALVTPLYLLGFLSIGTIFLGYLYKYASYKTEKNHNFSIFLDTNDYFSLNEKLFLVQNTEAIISYLAIGPIIRTCIVCATGIAATGAAVDGVDNCLELFTGRRPVRESFQE
jgi:hypothetical protein